MNYIRFDCPGCGQGIEAEEDAQFVQVKCPTCQHEFFPDKTQFIKPAPASPASPPPLMPKEPPKLTPLPPISSPSPNLRTCTDCGGKVSVHAEVCPHCGAPFIKRDPDLTHWTPGRVMLLLIFIAAVLILVFIAIASKPG
jgi:predicted RNA-binding Zn-ribbon protein involved in translation (DUF1610 family)